MSRVRWPLPVGAGVLGALLVAAVAAPATPPGASPAAAAPTATGPTAPAEPDSPGAAPTGLMAWLPSSPTIAPAARPPFAGGIVTAYSDAFPGNLVSATRDYTFEARLDDAPGRSVAVQRRPVDGGPWETVDAADLVDGRAPLTIPAIGRHVAMDYRLVLPATDTEPEEAGETQRIQHYRAEDLPHDDVAWTVSQVIAPYCQNTPVVVGDAATWVLDGETFMIHGRAYVHPDFPDQETLYISDEFAWNATQDYPSPTHTMVALHECAHIVSRTALGETLDAELAAAYPEVAEEYRTEAIADALAEHWATANPGGNVSRWFAPPAQNGNSAVIGNEDYFARFYPFDIATYPGDDALVERLTGAALARAERER